MSTHSLSRVLRAFLLAGMSFVLAGLSRADITNPGPLAFRVDVPGERLTAADIRDIILRASIGRAWEVKEDAENRIVIYLSHRKNEATVTYEFDAKQISAYCEGYATNGKGVRKGPEQPTGWLKFLKKDITKGLNEAAFLQKK